MVGGKLMAGTFQPSKHHRQLQKMNLLLDWWYDMEGTSYKVSLDKDVPRGNAASLSCSVTISQVKENGRTWKRAGIIRMYRNSMKITWGQNYVLDDISFSSSFAHWKHRKNSNFFQWTRYGDSSPPGLPLQLCAESDTRLSATGEKVFGLKRESGLPAFPLKPLPDMSPAEAESILKIGDSVIARFHDVWYEASILSFCGPDKVEVLWNEEESVSILPRRDVVSIEWI